jgi:hypothetical protein
MEFVKFETARAFERAVLGFYKNDRLFKNNKSGILKLITDPRGEFFANSKILMAGASENGEILCVCAFICHKAHDAVSASFFEAREGAFAATEFIMEKGAAFAKECGRKRIEISLDGHCNYSVGFSVGPATSPIFGESYNPEFYGEFFKGSLEIGFSAYTDSLENVEARLKPFAPALKKRGIDVIEADFKDFKDSIRRYSDLSNAIFQDHRYYFYRDYREDFRLFSAMKLLLKPCCILFAQKNGRDIGFLLMYPDFNELVDIGKGAGISTFIRHKILKRPISVIKIPEIGVLPEYQSGGAILFLLFEALRLARINYPSATNIVSGWILNENRKSINLVSKLAPNIYKRFAAYEKEV